MSFEEKPKRHHVKCECGFDERYASALTAKAIRDDHAEECFHTPAYEVLD